MIKRRYNDRCAMAHALDLVGERWALLIVRDLLLGPKRFTDLLAGLPGAGPNILAQRLRELETVGVVRRQTLPPPAGSRVYELTEWGAQLDPIVAALGQWGLNSPIVPPTGDIGADAIMLALRNSFRSSADNTWSATYEMRLGRDRFMLRVSEGKLAEASRGLPSRTPDTIIEATPTTLADLVTEDQTLEEAITAERLTVTGDVAAARNLLNAVRT